MDITQISPMDSMLPIRRVARAEGVAPIRPIRRGRKPWDETSFVAAYNRFAAQLGRYAFHGSDARLNELALLYERSSASTLEAFAANIAATQSE